MNAPNLVRRGALVALAVACVSLFEVARTQTPNTLDVYYVDVEGGQATLFVSPLGDVRRSTASVCSSAWIAPCSAARAVTTPCVREVVASAA